VYDVFDSESALELNSEVVTLTLGTLCINNCFYTSACDRWVDNIRTNLQEVGCEYMDWIGLAQDRERWRMFVSAVMNIRVP